MGTIAKSGQKAFIAVNAKEKEVKKEKEISAYEQEMEFNRFGYISMVLVVLGIVGGIAAAYGIQASWIQLAVVAFSATFCLALVLAVAPMRYVYASLGFALLVDLAIILMNSL